MVSYGVAAIQVQRAAVVIGSALDSIFVAVTELSRAIPGVPWALGRKFLARDIGAPSVISGVPWPQTDRFLNALPCGSEIRRGNLCVELAQLCVCLGKSPIGPLENQDSKSDSNCHGLYLQTVRLARRAHQCGQSKSQCQSQGMFKQGRVRKLSK